MTFPNLDRKLMHGVVLPVLLAGLLAGCTNGTDEVGEPPAERVPLGVMTSLPLYWPLGADIGALADGSAEVPWQRTVLEQHYTLELLDTLSPIPALVAGDPDTDPLAGLDRLAIIQPRGLSPSDNVALDDWVQSGGRLLLALDPLLTGEYDLALGDPRRPSDTALIPPVVARWGLQIVFNEDQDATWRMVRLHDTLLALAMAGEVRLLAGAKSNCEVLAEGAAAECLIGEGRVIVLADAAVFEHREAAGERGQRILGLLTAALDRPL